MAHGDLLGLLPHPPRWTAYRKAVPLRLREALPRDETHFFTPRARAISATLMR